MELLLQGTVDTDTEGILMEVQRGMVKAMS
jgi:hypothetical protein